MMLDSSLGKILSTKPVEPSITNNIDSTATTTASTTSTTTIATPNEESKAHSTKSEAEVRLVVRLFVEEHIVFNGRVERIKQLESEELTRIVSRIAWDGEGDIKKPVHEDDIKSDENTSCIGEDRAQLKLCEPTNIFAYDHDTPLDSISKLNGIIADQHDEHPTSNLEASHSFHPMSSLQQAVPIIETDSTTNKRRAIAMLDTEVSNLQCDNKPTTPIYIHICEARQEKESSYKNQGSIPPAQKDNPQESKVLQSIEHTLSEDISGDDEFSNAEHQTIADTLYDCVYNVELESRQGQANRLNRECSSKLRAEGVEKTADSSLHNESTNDTGNENAIPPVMVKNLPSHNEPTQETFPHNSDANNLGDEANAQAIQAGMDDLNAKMVSTKKPGNGGSCSTRRKITNENGPTIKRIRRVNSKDQRNQKITNEVIENKIDKHNIYANAEDENGQLTCQSKVFAKWSDNHFYPGIILKTSRDRKFEIGFFDGARKDIAESDLIPSGNILTKQVRVSIAKDYCVNAIVHEQVTNNDRLMFDVEYQQNGLVRKCVPFEDIFMTAEQGIPLINQTIRPDKKPDESMFAGVDLDNIVHVKRSRRLQEMEESEATGGCIDSATVIANGARRKRGQYNMRNVTNRIRSCSRVDVSCELDSKRSLTDIHNPDTPASSCSPDNLKATLDSPSLCSPSGSSSSRDTSKF